MQDRVLLEITVVTDDSTGCYVVGELDYGIHGYCNKWLEEDKGNRQKLAAHLKDLAHMLIRNEYPFGTTSVKLSEGQSMEVKDA